jgi:hypothetical protein
MPNTRYKLWDDGALWHYEVLTGSGDRLRHGATTDMATSRAEAMRVSKRPAIADEIDTLERAHSAALFEEAEKAFMYATMQREVTDSEMLSYRSRLATSAVLVQRSRAALHRSKQLLRADIRA